MRGLLGRLRRETACQSIALFAWVSHKMYWQMAQGKSSFDFQGLLIKVYFKVLGQGFKFHASYICGNSFHQMDWKIAIYLKFWNIKN